MYLFINAYAVPVQIKVKKLIREQASRKLMLIPILLHHPPAVSLAAMI